MRNVIALAIGLAVAAGVAVSPASAAISPQILLHRGGLRPALAVENTVENFHWADSTGYDNWEMDIRFAKNNIPVVMHDANYSTRGLFSCNRNVTDVSITWAKANCFHTVDNGEVIHPSSLADVTSEMKADNATAWMELKTDPTEAQWTVLETRISSLKSKIVIESFLDQALEEASARGYETARLVPLHGILSGPLPSGTDWIAPAYQDVSAAYVADQHYDGLKVAVWTPDPVVWPSLPVGIDAIISNYGQAWIVAAPVRKKK